MVQVIGTQLTHIGVFTGDLIGSAAGNGIVVKVVTYDVRIALDPLVEFLLLLPGGHLIIEVIKANIRGEDLLVIEFRLGNPGADIFGQALVGLIPICSRNCRIHIGPVGRGTFLHIEDIPVIQLQCIIQGLVFQHGLTVFIVDDDLVNGRVALGIFPELIDAGAALV